MKQNAYSRRPSGRSGGRNRSRGNQGQNIARQRNHAKQQLDKYLSLARDARMSGDRTTAEGYFQHAEHFQRVYSELVPTVPSPTEMDMEVEENGKGEAASSESSVEKTQESEKSNKSKTSATKEEKVLEEGTPPTEKKTVRKPRTKAKPHKKVEASPSKTKKEAEDETSVVEIDIEVTP